MRDPRVCVEEGILQECPGQGNEREAGDNDERLVEMTTLAVSGNGVMSRGDPS
jgi:hypothetical protein